MKRALLAMLVLVAAAAPRGVVAQHPVQIAFANPQPHFVAAWAPTEERAAEGAAVLVRRVSLDLTDVSLDVALKALTNQAGLRITYSLAVLPASKRVTISARNVAVVTALTEMLFRSGLDVVVDRDGAMALVRCRHARVEAEVRGSGAIVGRVTDEATGAVLVGATVTMDGSTTTTNTDGRFRFAPVAAGTYSVRARYIGYTATEETATVTDGSEITVDLALAKSIQRLAEVVTTGALVPTEVKALPSPVTVISRESIAQQRPRSLPELFRQAVPGAVSWDITTRPEETDFSVRGASTLNPGGSQMKVFVDGIEATAFGVTVVDPSSIDRVEVVRGPQAAAVYGSDAIGGVIQVFTKRGDPAISRPQLEAETAFGVVQTPYAGFGGVLRQTYAAAVRGGAPNVSYNFGAGYSRTADYLPYGEESSQSSPGVYGGVNYARGIVSVDVSGRYHVTNSPSVVNPELVQSGFVFYSKPLYQSTRWTNQTVGLRLGVAATPWWHHNLTLGIDEFSAQTLQSQPRLTTPDDTLFTLVNLASAKRSIGYSTSFQSDPGHQVSAVVTAGVDHWSLPLSVFATDAALKNSGPVQTPEGVPISASQFTTNNTGYYVQGQLGMSDALFLTAGLRGEENSNFGDSLGTPVSPRLGVSYARSVGAGTVKVRGSWGRAIRAPDPGAKLTTGPGRLPNPGLAPERQQGWDAGLDAVIGSRGSISVTYYHQMAENLIQFVRVQNDPEPLDQFQNVGEVKNTGIEIEGSLHLGRLELNANYAYTRARIKELGPNYSGDLRVGDQVRATPKHTAGAFLTLIPRHGTTLSSGIAYVGRYSQTDFVALFRCIGGTGPCTPDFIFVSEYPSFVKVNGTISQQLSPLVSGFLSIDNVGNSHAAESGNIFPVLGRITTAGVRVQW